MNPRREFIKSATAGAAVVTWGAGAAGRSFGSPNEKIVLGFMGLNGRGTDLANGFAAIPEVEIAYLCDVDDLAIAKAQKALASKVSKTPQGVTDFRRVLDDKAVDALVIAAPDHWHGPATIMACAAGKHVYVEKPASHNPREGEMMIQAARKHNRVVQLGTQRRSMPGIIEGIERLKAGEIGRVLFSRGWYNNTRKSIGHGKPAAPPATLDYTLWQGPAPERDYRDNLIHYNWHWFWHWGTGELGNNGIHALDICRWGLGVDYPLRVTAGGGKYCNDDDQETPDTLVVTYDYGDKGITWEGRSWHPRGFEGSQFGVAFYGDKGTMLIDDGSFRVLGMDGKELSRNQGSGSDQAHKLNFLECVRSGHRPNADIDEGHKSTLMCHLGNLAFRTGHVLKLDPVKHTPAGDSAASTLWRRDYRPGWEPRV